MYTYSRVLSVIILSLNVLCTTPVWSKESPGQIVVNTIDRGLQVLKDPSLKGSEKTTQRRDKLWKELEPIFYFEEIAKRALGHHWKDRSPQEKEQFTKVFTNILRNTYLSKTDNYSSESMVYVREYIKGKRCKVQTIVTTAEGKQLAVDINMKNGMGTWLVYDISIEGVSIVSSYRSQFNSILSKESFADLMDTLEEKQSELVSN